MDLDPDPLVQFRRWLDEAQAAGRPDPRAMTLATAGRDGAPAARMVILRELDERGFVFYTDEESPKGRDLAGNPRAVLVFYWPQVERQVRISGVVERTSREETARYFQGRPRGAQVAAWIPQSRVVASHAALEAELRALEERFGDGEVPLPPFWSGFRLRPDSYEFWQGQPSRLHDRSRYVREAQGGWRIEVLTP